MKNVFMSVTTWGPMSHVTHAANTGETFQYMQMQFVINKHCKDNFVLEL